MLQADGQGLENDGVLLTVHLRIILATDQLNPQIFIL